MTVADSYAFCERVARTQAKNFYYSFLLLQPRQRRAMCAIYAFMRYCDDLSDDEGISDRAAAISRWKQDLDAALGGQTPDHALWPAFTDTVKSFQIPHVYFYELIEGVSSDLEPRRLSTFDELYDYCYHVASVVGLTIIHIFEFDSPEALKLAEKCGVAFQLTNILRDVREDAEKDRIYLPEEDLVKFDVDPDELRRPQHSARLNKLLEFEADRARSFYRASQPLVCMVHRRSRASLRALIGIYARLLTRITDSGYDVVARRIRVPTWEKVWILVWSLFVGRSWGSPGVAG